jgi:hypothetical protein
MSGINKAILFYSKYSKKSMNIKKFIQSSNVDITLIGVDSPEIRNALKQDNKYKIREVPTIITIHNNGIIQLYDGKNLDLWISDLENNLNQEEEIVEPTVEDSYITIDSQEEIPQQITGIKPQTQQLSPMELAKQMAEERQREQEEMQQQQKH